MRNRKTIIKAAGILLLVGLLAACGTADAASTPEPLDLTDGRWQYNGDPNDWDAEQYRYVEVKTPDGVKHCISMTYGKGGGLSCWTPGGND